jgi:interferon gamma-inducible protein 30
VLATEDLYSIIDLKLVAYGNTQYNSTSGFTCQHGPNECAVDVYDSCLEYMLGGNDLSVIETGSQSKAAWPFILCMEQVEGDPSKAQGCFEQTNQDSSLTWSALNECATTMADKVQEAAMAATPVHDYVPWCLVDGEQLEHTNLLKKKVCDAYTGPQPASCSVKLNAEKDGSGTRDKEKSMNNWW